MTLATIFKRLGLRKHADAVYVVLSKHSEPLSVTQIAQRTRLARQQIYRNLEELMRVGFVSPEVTGKRTRYRAEPAQRIHKAFDAAYADSTQQTDRLGKEQTELPRQLRFLTGFAGIRAVFDDVVTHTPKGETFYRYTSERDLDAVNRYLSPGYRAQRDKKKLERLVISNPASGRQKRSRLERFIKYIEPETALFNQNIIQLVYGKRLAFINLNTEVAFIIEDEALASFQKVIFRQLYRKL